MVNGIDCYRIRKFYSLYGVCELLGISRPKLYRKCAQYGIPIEKDRVGVAGLYRPKIRRLYNKLRYEERVQREKAEGRA